MTHPQRLIIVGGNAAGMAAAMRARRNKPELDITIIERSNHISAANCSIPGFLASTDAQEEKLYILSPQAAVNEHRLNLLLNHTVISVSTNKHEITVFNNDTKQEFTLRFDRLILATGANPIKPNWPNIAANGIFTLRTPSDAVKLKDHLIKGKPRKLIIVGTGTIAQVCASSLHNYGLDITMFGLSSGLMTDLEAVISDKITETLVNNNINLYFTDNLYGIKVSLDNYITGIEEGNNLHRCDIALLAMGVQPNNNFCKSSGLKFRKNGEIQVDKHLKTNREAIYACGDCAETYNRITHKPVYWPLATTSARQGRQAGENASGGNGKDHGTLMTRLWTCFDLQIGRTGLNVMQASMAGINADKTEISLDERSSLVLIYEKNSKRIIGGQMVSTRNVLSMLNATVASIEGKLTLNDLEGMDFGYTPKLSTLWNPIQVAARQGNKKE